MKTSLFARHDIVKMSNGFNFYMLLCGNSALKLSPMNSTMAYYVHVCLHNAAKHVHYITSDYNLKLSKYR
jgi:hypothetical protein